MPLSVTFLAIPEKLMTHRAGRLFWTVISCFVIWPAASGCAAWAAPPPKVEHRFLIASDLHFNPMADRKLVDELNAAEVDKWESILNRSRLTAFSQYGEDTNWWLMRSALDAMRSTLPHPAFILVTGDMLAHQFPSIYQRNAKDKSRESYRKFVLKTMQFISLELRQRFPHTTILLTPGNNDDDCGDYNIEANGPFLNDTAEFVHELARADDAMKDSWKSLGSYDVPHPAIPKMRVLSLNSIFLSNKYRAQKFSDGCAETPSSAPQDVLAWLRKELNRAQQAHEKVWLMFHIPPGMDGYSTLENYMNLAKSEAPAQACSAAPVPMWVPQWTAQFDELLAKYRDTVTAAFAGHTHSDDFRIIDAGNTSASYVLINASISPVYNQNPSFRVATFHGDGSLGNQSVYYLTNLLYASSTTPGQWEQEYSFTREWKMPSLTAGSLAKAYGEIETNADDRADWLKLYNVSSSAAQLPPDSAPALYCAIEGLSPESYGKCFCGRVANVQPAK